MANIKSLFRASATSFTANNSKWSNPSKPITIDYMEDYEQEVVNDKPVWKKLPPASKRDLWLKDGDIILVGSDGITRVCRKNRITDPLEREKLIYALEFAYEHKLPVILRAMGDYNSTNDWFAEVTFVAYNEVAAACPLKAIGTSFA